MVMPASSTAPMFGMCSRCAIADVAGPVSPDPATATAPALTRRWNSCDESVADAWSLYDCNVNFFPSAPPRAFRSATASLAPFTIATPVLPYAPVVPAIDPIRMVFPFACFVPAEAESATASATIAMSAAPTAVFRAVRRECILPSLDVARCSSRCSCDLHRDPVGLRVVSSMPDEHVGVVPRHHDCPARPGKLLDEVVGRVHLLEVVHDRERAVELELLVEVYGV